MRQARTKTEDASLRTEITNNGASTADGSGETALAVDNKRGAAGSNPAAPTPRSERCW